MERAEAVIAGKLEALRKELAEKEEAERAYEARRSTFGSTVDVEHLQRALDIRNLEAQLRLLEELQATLNQQHAETKAYFIAAKDRDERSSKQNVWFSVALSAISIILGWLLSMLGSPAAVLHVLIR